MTKVTIVCLIAAGLITAVAAVITAISVRNRKAVAAWYEAIEERRKLKEYQKRRMCNNYCKYRETAKTQEELEWKCADCPVGEL